MVRKYMTVFKMVRMESAVMAEGEGVWFEKDGVGGREELTVSKNNLSC